MLHGLARLLLFLPLVLLVLSFPMYKDVFSNLRLSSPTESDSCKDQTLSIECPSWYCARASSLRHAYLLFYFYRFPARLSASYLYFQVFTFELYKHQVVTLEMSLFPLKSISVPSLPFSLINSIESKSYVFPFRLVLFYLVTTVCIFDF